MPSFTPAQASPGSAGRDTWASPGPSLDPLRAGHPEQRGVSLQSSPAEQSGWAAKLGALRYRDFRRFWFGYAISVSGLQMLWVVQGWLVYELSGSKLQLGFLGLVQVAPAVGLTFFAGVVADKVDQRRLLLATQLVQMALLAGIATVSLLEMVETWHILAFAAARVAADSFDHPTRQAMFPHLIRRDALTSAVALNAMVHPGTRVFGPALGGILLALILGQTGRQERSLLRSDPQVPSGLPRCPVPRRWRRRRRWWRRCPSVVRGAAKSHLGDLQRDP